ncbi:hypothetical protein [Microbacterium capsulatum]|uniref:J domain-containing protein n=1 Tax=Microbacterium capsulatum TaxID=3041921 RepID=A0ABU0XIR1_9MICO|nr:hypothetical protein [Microbacterium sp. ASV81]MDQ4215023.1 hypothetical protein [Microbacterium sp. ASV81]
MDLHPALSYRVSTLELEEAAVRAERARMAAEHPDQFVRRDGVIRRALRALAARRTVRTTAAVPAAPAREAATPGAADAAPVRLVVAAAEAEPAAERELVGCTPHAA